MDWFGEVEGIEATINIRQKPARPVAEAGAKAVRGGIIPIQRKSTVQLYKS